MFNSFKTGITSLYGNEGILIIMSQLNKSEKEYTDFLKKVFETKLLIRKKTMDPNVRLLEKISEPYNPKLKDITYLNGYPYLITRPKALSRLHCPDNNLEDTKTELDILLRSGIICNKNMLGSEDFSNVIKFGSIIGFNDDSQELRPDIATFESERLKDSLSR